MYAVRGTHLNCKVGDVIPLPDKRLYTRTPRRRRFKDQTGSKVDVLLKELLLVGSGVAYDKVGICGVQECDGDLI